MNKKLLLIFSILVGGCSTDSDIKLICNCETQKIDYYEGVNITSSNLEENSISNKIYSTPTKTIEEPCWGNRTKDVPVIFNDDKNSFLFSNFNEDKPVLTFDDTSEKPVIYGNDLQIPAFIRRQHE